MDHKEFESNMIDCVNRNSKNADEAQRMAYLKAKEKEAYLAAKEDKTYSQQLKKSDAAMKMLAWVGTFLLVSLFMFYLNMTGNAPGELPEAGCGLVGLIAGSRITALARVFKK